MGFPIFAIWAHPRSMSTAVERIMRERGDLDCAHEPFMYDYYVHRRAGQMPHFDVDPTHPTRYEDIRDSLLERAERGPVCIKDMSYYVMPHILSDAEFAARLRNVFLVRNPYAAIASYHRIDPQMSSEEIGIAAQWTHYQGLVERGGAPVVLLSERIRQSPKPMMRALWDRIGLDRTDHAFDWQNATPQDWQQVAGWHESVMSSQQIAPLPKDADTRDRAAFEQACQHTPHLRDYLGDHLPAYENLRGVALTL